VHVVSKRKKRAPPTPGEEGSFRREKKGQGGRVFFAEAREGEDPSLPWHHEGSCHAPEREKKKRKVHPASPPHNRGKKRGAGPLSSHLNSLGRDGKGGPP